MDQRVNVAFSVQFLAAANPGSTNIYDLLNLLQI